jgi:dienelactone hydrolase
MLLLCASRVTAEPVVVNTNPVVLMDATGASYPVTRLDDWAKRREQIVAAMQEVMGPLPKSNGLVPLDVKVENEKDFPKYVQKKITLAVENWDRLPVLVLVPKSLTGKAPAMLCLHPTSELGKDIVCGEGTKPNRNYGQELAERGYVVLAPDYPGFGDYVGARKALYGHGYTSATMKGIWNHMRCVDYLSGLPEVDPARIGCMGHSLGGHNTLFLGVFDLRIKVLVSSCGFTSFAKYYAGDLTGWTHEGYMPTIASVYGKDPARMPFDFPGVLAALVPRPLFINAPLHDANFDVSGVKDCVDTAQEIYRLNAAKGNMVAVHPDAEHDFPDETRQQAYAFVDKALRR